MTGELASWGRGGSIRLSKFGGRDNNFNLIRMVAALMVIEAHGCAMAGRKDPFHMVFGIGAGDIGVDIFFVLSGYLIAKSWAGKTWAEFAWARAMRIYPALWVSTVLSIVLVALFFSNGSALGFLARSSTLGYFWHNATMLPHFGAQMNLPGAFGATGNDFNVSLWTLPNELQMYMLLAAVGILIGVRARYMAAVTLVGAAVVVIAHFHATYVDQIDRGRFLYFFFSGALAFTLRERIVLSGRLAGFLTALIVLTLFIPSLIWREATLVIGLPYLILWCAYIPAGLIRLWNRLGDYSYGTYIFAHPIQMGLFTLGVAASWWANMILTIAIVLPLAALSWHLLEKRALRIPLPARGRPGDKVSRNYAG